MDRKTILTFDVDDLFYFSDKSIMKRGNHLFVAEYGMQTNILSRYGIRDHAVPGRDYYFSNGNPYDFRYGNVNIVNRYYGVQKIIKKGQPRYKTVIHINGNFVVGTYKTEEEAAIAYNKAVHCLKKNGCKKTSRKIIRKVSLLSPMRPYIIQSKFLIKYELTNSYRFPV